MVVIATKVSLKYAAPMPHRYLRIMMQHLNLLQSLQSLHIDPFVPWLLLEALYEQTTRSAALSLVVPIVERPQLHKTMI